MHIDRIVKVDAGQNRENVGLQKRDKNFQTRERHHDGERHETAQKAHGHNEACENFKHGVPGHHIGEQTH